MQTVPDFKTHSRPSATRVDTTLENVISEPCRRRSPTRCAVFFKVALMCAGLMALTPVSQATPNKGSPYSANDDSSHSLNPVVQWNRTLLVIVRTHGAQPATIHPTRSFAMMHAAIFDAVNSIHGTFEPYLAGLPHVTGPASADAAAHAAAHEVLLRLYPSFQTSLEAEFQQSLSAIQDSTAKTEGIRIGRSVAELILALRSNDGSGATPVPYIFGGAPGDYQSTPPNFPAQPQFTHWPAGTGLGRQVAGFVLEHFLSRLHGDEEAKEDVDN